MRSPFSIKWIYLIERRSFGQKYKFSNKNDMVSAWRNFKIIFSRPLFTIIFRPEMLKFHPYSNGRICHILHVKNNSHMIENLQRWINKTFAIIYLPSFKKIYVHLLKIQSTWKNTWSLRYLDRWLFWKKNKWIIRASRTVFGTLLPSFSLVFHLQSRNLL